MHGVSHQGNVTSKTSSFGWVWPGMPLVQTDCWILWSTISVERISWYLGWFSWRYSLREGSMWVHHLWLVEARLASSPIKIQDSLIVNISRRNQFIRLSDHCHFIFLFIYSLASFMELSWGPFSYDLFYNIFLTIFFSS